MAKMFGRRGNYLSLMGTGHGITSLLLIVVTPIFLIVYLYWVIFVRKALLMEHLKFPIIVIFVFSLLVFIYCYSQYKKESHKARSFFSGLKGEHAIEIKLEKVLGDEYSVFRDVKLNKFGNIDFVVVGPTGIFAIEVKNHGGTIGFDKEQLTRNGALFEKDILDQIMNNALSIHDLLKKKFSADIFIKPVIVFSSPWAKLSFGLKKQKNVYVIGKSWLDKFFDSQSVYRFPIDRALIEDELMHYIIKSEKED